MSDLSYEERKKHGYEKSTCNILKQHAQDLKDDPERLSTKFLQKIIGIKCKDTIK